MGDNVSLGEPSKSSVSRTILWHNLPKRTGSSWALPPFGFLTDETPDAEGRRELHNLSYVVPSTDGKKNSRRMLADLADSVFQHEYKHSTVFRSMLCVWYGKCSLQKESTQNSRAVFIPWLPTSMDHIMMSSGICLFTRCMHSCWAVPTSSTKQALRDTEHSWHESLLGCGVSFWTLHALR